MGPVIACVTSVNFDKEHLFHHLTDFFHEFAQYAERKSIFFTVKSLKKIDNFNTGYYYCDGKWLEDILPEPNAIYNRVAVRALEKTEAYDNFVNELNEKQIPYFNHRFLNKLEIHELLVKDERLQASIPDTVKLEEYDSFIAKLNEHGTIYVKPINGSKGRGILRIEKSVDCFIVYYSSFSNCETTTFRSSYVLYKRLIERINHLPYLIQQRIRLIKIDNRAIDFRVLCIKSVKGDWKVVSSVARVSPKENMVSNIAQGGLQIKTFELLKDLYEQQQAREFLTQIHKFALCVADSLCSNPSLGHFGELGVDIGLDEDGKLWLIEVNSKPSKIDDQRKDLTRPSTKALIAYLSSIGGFSIK